MTTVLSIRPTPRRLTLFALLAFVPAGGVQAQQTPPEQRLAGYQKHQALAGQSLFRHLPWQFLGPTNVSGRITDMAVVPPRGKSYTIYVAGASGGVWKTVNEGVTWEPVFQNAASTSIGDVTVAPSNPDIVWVGTGEANIFRSSMAGAGVYKSTDGGQTWAQMGLTGTYTIPRIVIDPHNPDIVYVAASGHEWTSNPERGVFKTTDGGRSWQKVLYVDERTGAIDLVMDPTDPNTLYAATWQRVRKKWNDPRNEADYTGSGIYKTTDGGRNWQPIDEGLPEARYRGRIGIDVARSRPGVVYAFVDNYEVAREPEPGALNAYGQAAAPVIRGATVYRSDDGGAHWRQVSENNRYMEGLSATYGWVFGQIRVDPSNENRIYVMGLSLNVSDDGGKTFRRLGGMHGDHHGLWIDPNNPDYLVNSNDGGVYVSYDAGQNWRNFTNLLPLAQFFDVAYDMATPFHVYGSIQDHGSRRGVVDLSHGRNAIPAVAFENAPGGEGSSHAIDPTDADIVYSAGFYGNISRTNIATGESTDITPKPPKGEPPYRGQWVAPFILSPHNPRVIYHGFNYLFRSMDRGDTWERISPDLTSNDPARLGDIPYQTIFSISESPLKFGLIYAGTDDGHVHVTRDGGQSWTEIAKDLPRGKFIAELVASAFHEGTVYMAQNGKRDDDFTPYIWKSTDYGKTWTSIVGNIPLGPVNVIKEDPTNPAILYVGTDLGAYVSLDGGASWNVLADGLPSTFVHDLAVHPRDDILVAATHGRGMFALDVRPIRQLTPAVLARNTAVLDGEPARLPPQGRGGFGRGGMIPANIYYYLRAPGAVTVTVKDGNGATVRELQGTGDAGLNLVVWDLSGPGGAPAGRRGGFGGRGNLVSPGIYTVEVRQGGNTAVSVVQVGR